VSHGAIRIPDPVGNHALPAIHRDVQRHGWDRGGPEFAVKAKVAPPLC
jgi:hypothetical protein